MMMMKWVQEDDAHMRRKIEWLKANASEGSIEEWI